MKKIIMKKTSGCINQASTNHTAASLPSAHAILKDFQLLLLSFVPKCSQKSIVLSGCVIISELLLFFSYLFGSYQCTWFFSLASCICFFFFLPSRTISGDLKRMKETTETKLECIPSLPPPHRARGTDPRLCAPVFSLPLATSTLHLITTQAKGKMATSPGAMMCGLRGSAVFGK